MDDVDTNEILDSDDVEQDCWPSSAASAPGRYDIAPSEYSKLKNSADDWCDSGYEKSVDSLHSGNLLSDTNEGRPEINPEFGLDVDNFKNLSIGIRPSNSKCVYSTSKLDSIDEGFSADSEPHKPLLPSVSDINRTDNRELIEEIFQQDEDGDTQLHTSIIQLLASVALEFISIVADVRLLNLCNNYLQTPLHLAVITKQPRLARKLITAGAQVDVRDHKGNTPLHIAAKEGCAAITTILLEPIQHDETMENLYEIAYQHIPQNLNARNYDGQLSIHLAAEGTHLDVLQVLLEKEADINARDGKSGRTILHYAAESGNLPLLRFLFGYRSLDINAVTYGGLTAIMLAKGRGYDDIAKTLRTAGAQYDSSEDSSEEEMNEDSYDDIMIDGQPVRNGPC